MSKASLKPKGSDDRDKIRLSLELSPEVNRRLKRTAKLLGETKSDVLRRALALMEAALAAKRAGRRVGSVKPGKDLDTEFVGF